jgi:hypothetical protein
MRSPSLRYWTTKARSVAAVDICTKLVVLLCRFGRSRAEKTLAFSRPSRAWCGCLSVWSCSSWASFSACVLSPYISSSILPMSPPDVQVFVVSFPGNEQICPPLPFPSCSMKYWKWGRREMEVSDFLSIHKKYYARQSIKNLEIFLMDNLYEYCCELSQRTSN